MTYPVDIPLTGIATGFGFRRGLADHAGEMPDANPAKAATPDAGGIMALMRGNTGRLA